MNLSKWLAFECVIVSLADFGNVVEQASKVCLPRSPCIQGCKTTENRQDGRSSRTLHAGDVVTGRFAIAFIRTDR